MKTNIRMISGNWVSGVVLDKHTVKSVPTGYNNFGHMQFDTTRTEVGEALFQLKNRNDWDQIEPLADELRRTAFPLFSNIELIVPVPPSKTRAKQPVYELAKALAGKTGLTSFENIIHKSPDVVGAPQLKDLSSKEEKSAALAGRFSISDQINGDGKWNALIIDDLFDSGASMEAVCAALLTYRKIGKIYVTALTWK